MSKRLLLQKEKTLTINKLKKIIRDELEDNKAIDLTILDVRHLTSMLDYMFICTGRSTRQVSATANNLVKKLKEQGLHPIISGKENAQWVLVDVDMIVVHIMLPETRSYYQLEKLWDIPNFDKAQS